MHLFKYNCFFRSHLQLLALWWTQMFFPITNIWPKLAIYKQWYV
jgi:hypothetical protein